MRAPWRGFAVGRVSATPSWDHDLCRAVVAVFLRVVLGFLRARARRRGVANGRGGAVAILQRFGAALNLNVHVHAVVLDGVFAQTGSSGMVFHQTSPLSDGEVAAVLDTVRRRVVRLLDRRGLAEDDSGCTPDRFAEEAPILAAIGTASVQGRIACGPRRGARVRRFGDPPEETDARATAARCHARSEGFDLHAGVVAPAGHRHRLERLCQYALRPPIAEERLHLTPDGQVMLQLRHRWSDGTTHVLFEPLELLERLAVLTPRPRVNLILYHGVLAPRAAWRRQVVGRDQPIEPDVRGGSDDARHAGQRPASDRTGTSSRTWAELMRRGFGFDVLACPRCGQRMRLIALIDQADVVQRILHHLDLPTEVPEPAPARAPPSLYWTADIDCGDDDLSLDPSC